MITLDHASLLDDMPPNLAIDAGIRSIAKGLDRSLQQLAEDISLLNIFPGLANVPEDILDALAWQFHLNGYRQIFSQETKLQLMQQALPILKSMGTVEVILQVVNAIFGGTLTLQEWFQYAGAPYHFRVIADGTAFATDAQQATLVDAIRAVKRASAIFDGIVLSQSISQGLHIGISSVANSYQVIY